MINNFQSFSVNNPKILKLASQNDQKSLQIWTFFSFSPSQQMYREDITCHSVQLLSYWLVYSYQLIPLAYLARIVYGEMEFAKMNMRFWVDFFNEIGSSISVLHILVDGI